MLFRSQAVSGNLNQSISSLGQVAAKRPNSVQAQMMLADVQLAAKNYDAAIAALERARARLESFYKLTAPIYADLLQLVHWPVGMSMPPHADNAYPDGTPHEMGYRDFGAVAYLNDDFEGGELYFTALDIVIKPRQIGRAHV